MQTLSREEQVKIAGGDLTDTIDGACANIGVGTLLMLRGWTTKLVPAAFCAGWALGRLFT